MQRPTRSHHALLAWLIGMACLSAIAAYRWPASDWLAADFRTLLPDNKSSHWVSVADKDLGDSYAGMLVWLVEGAEADKVNQFAEAIRQSLRDSGYADPDYDAAQLASWKKLTQTLLQHHRGLITAEDYLLLQQSPKTYFEQTRRLLYSPLGGLPLSLLNKDPSGLFASYLQHITPSTQATMSPRDSVFSELLIGNVATEKLGFSNLPGLYDLHQRLQEQATAQQLTLYASGAPLYTAYGVQSAKREMSTIGLASLGLLIILLFVNLRSLTAVALTIACIFSGVVAGVLTTVAAFQQIHIFTLVFGASLIGIAADYALHYLAHSRSKNWTAALALEKVYRALRLSMLSSVTAFSALMFLPFPGISQIGLFMASGLICAFLTVCLLFPSVYRGTTKTTPLRGIWARPPFYWRHSWRVLLVLMLAAAVGISQLPTIDDVRAFYVSPPSLVAAQNEISRAMSDTPDSRYLLLEAPDQPQLLQLEEQMGKDLRQLQVDGSLASFRGIGTLIPAPTTQIKSATLLASDEFAEHLKKHMALLGVSNQQQGEVLSTLQRPFEPLQISTLPQQTLPIGVGGFLGCDTGGCASRITLTGVNNLAELEIVIERYPGAQLIDQVGAINTTMGTYRRTVSSLFLAATMLIATVLTLAYGWRFAAGILVTPMATCLLSLFLVGFWQGGLSLINVMALLLLIGVSLDYAIFRAFSAPAEQAATALAISLSAATSILAFGILSFSDTPIIQSFGLTIAVGLCFAWLFSWIRLSDWENA